MMLSWCSVTKNIEMSLLFLLSLWELFPSFEFVFISRHSRQVRGNCLLIHGELYQRTLKQDVTEAKAFLASFKEHLRGLLCDRKAS